MSPAYRECRNLITEPVVVHPHRQRIPLKSPIKTRGLLSGSKIKVSYYLILKCIPVYYIILYYIKPYYTTLYYTERSAPAWHLTSPSLGWGGVWGGQAVCQSGIGSAVRDIGVSKTQVPYVIDPNIVGHLSNRPQMYRNSQSIDSLCHEPQCLYLSIQLHC